MIGGQPEFPGLPSGSIIKESAYHLVWVIAYLGYDLRLLLCSIIVIRCVGLYLIYNPLVLQIGLPLHITFISISYITCICSPTNMNSLFLTI